MPQAQDETLALRGVLSLEVGIPDPVRKLGTHGSELWTRLWLMNNSWISMLVDLDHVTLLCEAIDERAALREMV